MLIRFYCLDVHCGTKISTVVVHFCTTVFSFPTSRLQRMAVFDEISGAEKPKITSAGAQTSYQVRFISQPRCKIMKNVSKTIKIRTLGAN